MRIKYTLTIGQLIRANFLLTYYRAVYPLLFFGILFLGYCYYINSFIPILVGIPGGIILSAISSITIGNFNLKRNKHFAGKRDLEINQKGYKYLGEQFSREANWSVKRKIWDTPWYLFLDVGSIHPVIVDKKAITKSQSDEIKTIIKNSETEPTNPADPKGRAAD